MFVDHVTLTGHILESRLIIIFSKILQVDCLYD